MQTRVPLNRVSGESTQFSRIEDHRSQEQSSKLDRQRDRVNNLSRQPSEPITRIIDPEIFIADMV